ncbi:unnamed protein product, partial [Didymodactylos carnosus]
WVRNSTASQIAAGKSIQGIFSSFQTRGGKSVAIEKRSQSLPVLYGTGQGFGGFLKAQLAQQAPASSIIFSNTEQLTHYDFFIALESETVHPQYVLLCTDQRLLQLGQQDYCNRYDMLTGTDLVLADATVGVIGYFLNDYNYGGYRHGVADQNMIFSIDYVSGVICTFDIATGVHAHNCVNMSQRKFVNLIAINPRNYQTCVVYARSNVLQTLDFGATWTDVTGTLLADSSSREMPYAWCSVVIPMTKYNALASRTALGVYIVFGRQTDSSTEWRKLGLALSKVFVISFSYDSSRNLIVASTMGHGWWPLSRISEQPTFRMNDSRPLYTTATVTTTPMFNITSIN